MEQERIQSDIFHICGSLQIVVIGAEVGSLYSWAKVDMIFRHYREIYIYADTEKYAFEIADCIAYKICKNLSYLAQLHNADTHYFHVKFYYYTRNIKILEKKSLM